MSRIYRRLDRRNRSDVSHRIYPGIVSPEGLRWSREGITFLLRQRSQARETLLRGALSGASMAGVHEAM